MKTSLTTLLIAAASALLLAAPTLIGAQLAAAPLRKDTRHREAVQRRRRNESVGRIEQRGLEGSGESNDHTSRDEIVQAMFDASQDNFIDVNLGLESPSGVGPMSMPESMEETMSMATTDATAAIVSPITTTTASKPSESITDADTTPSTRPTSKAAKMPKPEPISEELVTTPTIEEEGAVANNITTIVGSALSENASSMNSPIAILVALGGALTMLW